MAGQEEDVMRRIGLTLASSALAIGLAVPVAAQGPTLTEVVTGLDSPRGVAIAADGSLYVAEVGTGGTEDCITHAELGEVCFGMTGGISQVVDGVATRVVDSQISGVTATGETLGLSDVSVADDGTVWYTFGFVGAGAAELRETIPGAEAMGKLYRLEA